MDGYIYFCQTIHLSIYIYIFNIPPTFFFFFNNIMDQFDIVKRIGSGSFGVALLVKKKNEDPSSSQYVIKQINLTGMSAKEIKEAEHEVSVLQTLSGGNSFIIGYHEAFTETKKLHIVLDYADGGDLANAIE